MWHSLSDVLNNDQICKAFKSIRASTVMRPQNIWFWVYLEMYLFIIYNFKDFLGGTVDKNLPADAGDTCSIPGSGTFPWRRKWQLTPVFFLGKSHGWGTRGLQSMGSQRAGHDLATQHQQHPLPSLLFFKEIHLKIFVYAHPLNSKPLVHCYIPNKLIVGPQILFERVPASAWWPFHHPDMYFIPSSYNNIPHTFLLNLQAY